MPTDATWVLEDDMAKYDSEVKFGAAWLDAHYPGWAERVDLAVLDQSDGDR